MALSTIVASNATRWARVVLVVFVAIAGLLPTWNSLSARQTNVDLIAEMLGPIADRGDFVVVNHLGDVSFGRYYKGNAHWTAVPFAQWHPKLEAEHLKEVLLAPDCADPLISRISQTLRGGHRVWLVGVKGQISDGRLPPPPPPGWGRMKYMEMQVGNMIQTHAITSNPRPLKNEVAVMEFQNFTLTVASGWKSTPDEPGGNESVAQPSRAGAPAGRE